MGSMWKPVNPALGPYEVNAKGEVRRIGTENLKKLTTNAAGYPVVGLWHKNRGVVCYVHHLVAEAFIGPRPPGAHINHLDGDKTNPAAENLEYCTPVENAAHAKKLGLLKPRSKLTENEVRTIFARAHAGERTSTLAEEYGVKPPIVSQIKSGSRWGHLNLRTSSPLQRA